jgi:hypothetical protein
MATFFDTATEDGFLGGSYSCRDYLFGTEAF